MGESLAKLRYRDVELDAYRDGDGEMYCYVNVITHDGQKCSAGVYKRDGLIQIIGLLQELVDQP